MAAQPLKRNLYAILAADVAGFSRVMGENEEEAFRILRAHRAVTDSIIELHGGRIFNTAGDSVLAAFESPVEAVRAAIEIQDAVGTRNVSLPEERRLAFRIGLNLGDVIIKDDDLLGDAVNVAARLESQAEPGGLCISGTVYDQIVGKLDLRFEAAGELTLKNIARPVRAYTFGGSASAAKSRTTPANPTPKKSQTRNLIVAVGAVVITCAAVLLINLQPMPKRLVEATLTTAPLQTAATAGRYDGMWSGTWCPRATEQIEAVCVPRAVRVAGDHLTAEWGKPGEPGFMRLSGVIQDDGAVELNGSGVAGQGRNRGQPITVALQGRIRGDVLIASGKINNVRDVELNLARTQR